MTRQFNSVVAVGCRSLPFDHLRRALRCSWIPNCTRNVGLDLLTRRVNPVGKEEVSDLALARVTSTATPELLSVHDMALLPVEFAELTLKEVCQPTSLNEIHMITACPRSVRLWTFELSGRGDPKRDVAKHLAG